MRRITMTVVLFLSLVLSASAQRNDSRPTTDLGTVRLNLDTLKEWGTKKYTFRWTTPGTKEQAGAGTMVLRTEVKDDAVVLHDDTRFTHRGKNLSLSMSHHCRHDSFLSPSRIESKGEGDDELGTFVAIVEQGKAKVTSDGKERIINVPEDTVSFSAMLRIVTLLPIRKGIRISFNHWLESSELHLKKSFVVESLGQGGRLRVHV